MDCNPIALNRSDWRSEVADNLEQMMAAAGCTSSTFSQAAPPLATFDWDNTMAKNDIGEATLWWMLLHNRIKSPGSGEAAWETTSRFLLPTAAKDIAAACDAQVEPNGTLRTSDGNLCAKQILSLYNNHSTVEGNQGFAKPPDSLRTEPSYAWLVALLAGYSERELRTIAQQVIKDFVSAPIGSRLELAGFELPGYIRVYEPMAQLVSVLRSHGFRVRVVSASAQPLVTEFGSHAGFAADEVIGVRVEIVDGKWSKTLQSCGGDRDSMTYMDGKRCWINQAIYGDSSATAWQPRPNGQRQVFAAGDAETDLTMLRDASVRLIIDRKKPALLCHALTAQQRSTSSSNLDRWLIQPMFIEPMPRATEKYRCDVDACLASDGEHTACKVGEQVLPAVIEPNDP